MSIFSKKQSGLFDFVLNRTKELNRGFDLGVKPQLQKNRLVRIIEGDQKSPMIMGLGKNKHLIFYPKNSTPYLHQYETSIKFVEILSGQIIDQLTEKVYKAGDRFKIYPKQQMKPYTKDLECYVRVCVTQVDDIWERVCG